MLSGIMRDSTVTPPYCCSRRGKGGTLTSPRWEAYTARRETNREGTKKRNHQEGRAAMECVAVVVAGGAARSGWLSAVFWLRNTTTRPEVVHRFTKCVFAHSPQSQKSLLGMLHLLAKTDHRHAIPIRATRAFPREDRATL